MSYQLDNNKTPQKKKQQKMTWAQVKAEIAKSTTASQTLISGAAQKIIGDLGTVTKYEIRNRSHIVTVYTRTDGISCDTESLWPVTGVGRDLQEAVDDVRAQIKRGES